MNEVEYRLIQDRHKKPLAMIERLVGEPIAEMA